MTEQQNKQDIFDAIFDIVRHIPKGRVTSYGAISASIGVKSGARMVGHVLRSAPVVKPKVPAHRVVNSQGLLTGRHHFSPPEKMQQLLEKEGVKVQNNKILNFNELFWDPMKELSL